MLPTDHDDVLARIRNGQVYSGPRPRSRLPFAAPT